MCRRQDRPIPDMSMRVGASSSTRVETLKRGMVQRSLVSNVGVSVTTTDARSGCRGGFMAALTPSHSTPALDRHGQASITPGAGRLCCELALASRLLGVGDEMFQAMTSAATTIGTTLEVTLAAPVDAA